MHCSEHVQNSDQCLSGGATGVYVLAHMPVSARYGAGVDTAKSRVYRVDLEKWSNPAMRSGVIRNPCLLFAAGLGTGGRVVQSR